jgi:hypothetical protein
MAGSDTPVVVLGDLNDGQLSNALNILTDQPSYRVFAGSTVARQNDAGLYDHSERRHWSFRTMKIWNDFIDDRDPASSDHGIVRTAFDLNPAPRAET